MSSAARYFSTLNYTLANEDTALEVELLPESCGGVLTIAGSGGRALPLLARAPRRLHCVDLSPSQLYLTELRLALTREAELEDFLTFFGYPQRGLSPSEREATQLRQKWIEKLQLSSAAREFLRGWLEELEWRTPLYDGKWERTFVKLSSITQKIVGSRGKALFECKTLDEQLEFLRRDFPRRRWGWVIALLGNASVFNALLYKGSFPVKNIPGSRRKFYEERYNRILESGPARENFFLQLTFLGRLVYPEGNPVECDPKVFLAAKQALTRTEVTYHLGDAVSVAAAQKSNLGFVSFSDVPSYFSGELERTFLQKIRSGLQSGAKVVVRNYLHHPEGCDRSGYSEVSSQHQRSILREKVGVYDVEIFVHD